jgi:hypothetical protein
MEFNELIHEVQQTAQANGCWTAPRPMPELLCLIHS